MQLLSKSAPHGRRADSMVRQRSSPGTDTRVRAELGKVLAQRIVPETGRRSDAPLDRGSSR